MKSVSLISLIFLFAISNLANKVYGQVADVLLVSPLKTNPLYPFENDLEKLRFIAFTDTISTNVYSKINDVEYLYYKNFNRIYPASEDQLFQIYEFLGMTDAKEENWFLKWPSRMSLEKYKEAKSYIGLNFCKVPEIIDTTHGFVPILDLEYFKKLTGYNFVSDILEAYELEHIFRAQIFETQLEAKVWGLLQIQALRGQYVYFNHHLKYADPMLNLLEDPREYIGGMNSEELNNYFNIFKARYTEIAENNRFDFLKVIQI